MNIFMKFHDNPRSPHDHPFLQPGLQWVVALQADRRRIPEQLTSRITPFPAEPMDVSNGL
jgi:hypothetical protein